MKHPLLHIIESEIPTALRSLARNRQVVDQAIQQNPWFSEFYIQTAIQNLLQWFQPGNLANFLKSYPEMDGGEQTVGIIMAGNLPLVGFHDWLMTLLAGHRALVRLSRKDQILFSSFLDLLPAELQNRTQIVPAFNPGEVDFVMATGSNNTARYFESDFRGIPALIRRNRYSVAVLTGNENAQELAGLAEDILLFNGMGCRNVSNILLTGSASPANLLAALADYPKSRLTPAYQSVLNWELAIQKTTGTAVEKDIPVIPLEVDHPAPVRIGCLHLIKTAEPEKILSSRESEIQCIVRTEGPVIFGQTQSPGLGDFADGSDTLRLLLEIGQERS